MSPIDHPDKLPTIAVDDAYAEARTGDLFFITDLTQCGIVVREGPHLMTVEAIHKGVILNRFSYTLDQHAGDVVLARFGSLTPGDARAVYAGATGRVGTRYNWFRRHLRGRSICSEFVASVFADVGFTFQPDDRGHVTPETIWGDPALDTCVGRIKEN